MLLRTPDAVTSWFADRIAPVVMVIATNGQRPGDPRPMQFRGLGFCAFGVDPVVLVPASASGAVVEAVRQLQRHAVFVADAYEEQLAYATLFGDVLLDVAGDLVLSRALLKPRVPTVPLGSQPKPPTPDGLSDEDLLRSLEQSLPALGSEVEDVQESLLQYGVRLPYQIELEAALVLARAAALGYANAAAGRVYPTWHTTHPSGSANITAAGPALTSVSAAARRDYPADPGHRWVQIEWLDPEVAILAGRTGSSWLKQAAFREAPYEAFAELWDMPVDEARTTLRVLLTTGPDETLAEGKGVFAETTRKLAHVAPEWVEWGATLVTDATQDSCVKSFMGRYITVSEPRKACALDVQATQAMLLKMLIGRVAVEAQARPRIFAGFRCPLPVYAKLAYQIDIHVPLADHIPVAQNLGLLFVGANTPLRARISMGPTWGQLTTVAVSKQSQAEQDLLSPASYAIRCPLCEGVAADETTLAQHARDEHGVTKMDTFLQSARELVEGDA